MRSALFVDAMERQQLDALPILPTSRGPTPMKGDLTPGKSQAPPGERDDGLPQVTVPAGFFGNRCPSACRSSAALVGSENLALAYA
jgi:hypothetical protein